jgi:hypothetical protein
VKKPTFDITISKDGKVSVKVSGVSGRQCIELTDMLASIVGREDSRRLTDEYHAQDGHVMTGVHVRGRSE